MLNSMMPFMSFEPQDMSSQDMQSAASSRQAVDEVHQLVHEMQRLRLYNQALWELLRERARLTDEDLLKKVEEIDLRDGVADGKITEGPMRCPKCGRVSNSRHYRCLYCGLEFEKPVMG